MLLVTPENRGAHYTCAEPHSSPFYNTLIRFFTPDSSTIRAESEICCIGDVGGDMSIMCCGEDKIYHRVIRIGVVLTQG